MCLHLQLHVIRSRDCETQNPCPLLLYRTCCVFYIAVQKLGYIKHVTLFVKHLIDIYVNQYRTLLSWILWLLYYIVHADTDTKMIIFHGMHVSPVKYSDVDTVLQRECAYKQTDAKVITKCCYTLQATQKLTRCVFDCKGIPDVNLTITSKQSAVSDSLAPRSRSTSGSSLPFSLSTRTEKNSSVTWLSFKLRISSTLGWASVGALTSRKIKLNFVWGISFSPFSKIQWILFKCNDKFQFVWSALFMYWVFMHDIISY